jgi:hypothetical protein
VQNAFPLAEVHLLADSSPFLDNTAHWPEWRDVWNLQLPAGCTDCAETFSALPSYLATSNPDRRLALITPEKDPVIAYYFFGAPGLDSIVTPPVGLFATELSAVQAQYEGLPNARYFVVPGEQHVQWGSYGVATSDGGTTAPVPSRDGGTDLKAWIDAWATGEGDWSSQR